MGFTLIIISPYIIIIITAIVMVITFFIDAINVIIQ